MAVDGIGSSHGRRPIALSRSADEPADKHRALVPMHEASVAAGHGAHAHRLSATFLAQLIATKEGEPQTRERRRVTPDIAARAYAAALRLNGPRRENQHF